jgi:hypothetical protein
VISNAEVVCAGGVEGSRGALDANGPALRCETRPHSCRATLRHIRRARMGHMALENRKIEPERGDSLETRLESEERKSKGENGIAGVRGSDSRRSLIDRRLLS